MDSDTLDIFVLDAGVPDSLPVLARFGHDMAIESLNCDGLSALGVFARRLQRAILAQEDKPSADELVQFGHALFEFLAQGRVRRLYDRLPDSHVRIQLVSNHPEIQAIPWEYLLEHDTAIPRRERCFVRVVPTMGRAPLPPLARGESVRVLYVAADPLDMSPVSWDDVRGVIEDELMERLYDDRHLVSFDAIQGTSWQRLCRQLGKECYDIVHFVGHGEIVEGVGHVVFTDPRTDRSQRVDSQRLAALLQNRGIRLIILSACDTARGDFASEFSVIARDLVQTGMPFVVANQAPFNDSLVAVFVSTVYEELWKNGDVDRAITEGRIGLFTDLDLVPGEASIEWGVPVLYRHFGSTKVFEE